MKTDTELLEYLLAEMESIQDLIMPNDPEHVEAINRLECLVQDIYDHLGSKAIQTDYVMKAVL